MSLRVAAMAVLVACVGALPACSSDGEDRGTDSVEETRVASGQPAEISEVARGFDRPTQIADGPSGTVLVAQLAGDERDGSGQVVAFDPATGERSVVLSELDTPTGVLWADGAIWVMASTTLLRAEWAGPGAPAGPVETVLAELASNGRSEGSLTPLGDGRFLYETSGSLTAGGEVQEGGASLWVFDPATRSSEPVATNAKNAYAHATLPDGRIATTEIGDSRTDPPPDALYVLPPPDSDGAPADLGWPACRPEHRDDDPDCDGVVPPVATFPAASTPTGLALVDSEVDGDANALVALFVTGEVVQVDLAGWQPGDPTRRAVVVADGMDGPLGLLARPDGQVWLTEHGTGRILSLTTASEGPG